jgi:formylglycine-generating enzyme required for sulfatase activity
MKHRLKKTGCSRLLSIAMTVFVFTGCGKKQPVKEKAWTVPNYGMKFVYVAPGSFQMSDSNNNEKSVNRVTLSRGYWIGKYEVTESEYEKIMGVNPSQFDKGPNKPVTFVRWNDAVKFCQKLTARERAAGRLPSGYEYRLPTEAEWEFAARGGVKSRGYKYSGSDSIDSVAWYDSNSSKKTHEVGTKSGNELGLYDMSGNVSEWCNERRITYSSSSKADPTDAASTGSSHVLRGGNWYFDARSSRPAKRIIAVGDGSTECIGFRVVLAPSLK